MTFSILGRDSSNGDLGVAVQSRFPGVGSLVPYGRAELGVVATQAFANPRHGSVGLELLEAGASPRQAADILLDRDDARGGRQFAILGRDGDVATYSGPDLDSWDGWAGDHVGDNCVALGNGLAEPRVVAEMVRAFEGGSATIAERLIAALEAGQRAGGDVRGQQSAALSVFRRAGGYGSLDDRHVVISIYDHPRPIAELARCYKLHRLSYFASDPADLVPITPELALELKALMSAATRYEAPIDDTWDSLAQHRFALFLGSENYDNRINGGQLLDLEVLADLRKRYPAAHPPQRDPKCS